MQPRIKTKLNAQLNKANMKIKTTKTTTNYICKAQTHQTKNRHQTPNIMTN